MKTALKHMVFSMAVLASFLVISGCNQDGGHGGGLSAIIEEANTPFNDEEKVASVTAPTQKAGLAHAKYQGGTFQVLTRKDEIERFQCSKCHNKDEVKIVQAAEMAHGDIELEHGERHKRLTCFGCHKNDERDYLVTEDGEKIDFDHAYILCGQCHFRQKRDWQGGAHGKRVSYWAGRRVVNNCTSCHNPHSPKFPKRWPATYSPPMSESL